MHKAPPAHPAQDSLPFARMASSGEPSPEELLRPTELPKLDTFSRRDAFEFLKSLPDESVDLVITDPPYESLQLHRAKGTTTRLVGDWFNVIPNDRLPELLEEIARVLKPDRHFYLFCDEITADVIKEQQGITSKRESDGSRICKCGLTYWRELIWAKTNREESKIHGGMGYHYRSACERVMFFEKGKLRLNDLGVPDVLLAARPPYKAPAGKPLKVCQTLVTQSTAPGELVVDPFAGSGVVALAASENGRHFVINDLDDSYLMPEVRALVEPKDPRFLLVTPACPSPDVFLQSLVDALTQGGQLPNAVAHDLDMLNMNEGNGPALVNRLAETRSVEREAIFRRSLRSSRWAKAARGTLASKGDVEPTVAAWLRWMDQ